MERKVRLFMNQYEESILSTKDRSIEYWSSLALNLLMLLGVLGSNDLSII